MNNVTVRCAPGRVLAERMHRADFRPRSPIVGLAVICGALAMVMGSMTSLNTALPEIGRATGATQGQLTWVIDSYTVVFAGLLLPCGALGDRYGRRRALMAGLVVFSLACLLGPLGENPDVLIASRALAGVGAALVMPATLSLITTTMRGAAQERAVAVWVTTATLGGALGLAFGGLILEFADWPAILYVSAAAALLTTLAGPLIEESRDDERHRFDSFGAVTSAAAIGLVVFGINEAPSHGWDSAVFLGCVASGVACAVLFGVSQVRRAHPLLDIRIFRSRRVLAGSVSLVVQFAMLFGFFFLVVQYLQLIEGRSPLNAGLMLLPAALTILPFALAGPPLVERFGLRVVSALGFVPLTIGFLLLTQLEKGDTVLFQTGLLSIGATLGLCVTPATVAILRSVPAAKQGVASAVNDAVREVGAAIGIAVAGSLLATGYNRELGPAVEALPPPAREAAEASLAGALQVGAELGPAAAPAVAEAQTAFLSGLHGAMLACAIVTVVCAAAVALAAPGRQRSAETTDADAT